MNIINNLIEDGYNKIIQDILKQMYKYWPINNVSKESSFVLVLVSTLPRNIKYLENKDIMVFVNIVKKCIKYNKIQIIHDLLGICKCDSFITFLKENTFEFRSFISTIQKITSNHWSNDLKNDANDFLSRFYSQ